PFVGKDRIRFGNLLEAVRGSRIVGIGVGMVLLRQLPVCLLDLVAARVLSDAEDLVEIFGSGCHVIGGVELALVRSGSGLSLRASSPARGRASADRRGSGSPSGKPHRRCDPA